MPVRAGFGNDASSTALGHCPHADLESIIRMAFFCAVSAASCVAQEPLTISADLPPGTPGVAYSGGMLKAAGGASPYTFRKTSGSKSLRLSKGGSVASADSLVAGIYYLGARVTNGKRESAEQTFRIVVSNPLDISPQLNGTADTGFGATLQASGGMKPYTWSVLAAPAGTSDGAVNDDTLAISFPPDEEPYSFLVEVRDSLGLPPVVAGYTVDPSDSSMTRNPDPQQVSFPAPAAPSASAGAKRIHEAEKLAEALHSVESLHHGLSETIYGAEASWRIWKLKGELREELEKLRSFNPPESAQLNERQTALLRYIEARLEVERSKEHAREVDSLLAVIETYRSVFRPSPIVKWSGACTTRDGLRVQGTLAAMSDSRDWLWTWQLSSQKEASEPARLWNSGLEWDFLFGDTRLAGVFGYNRDEEVQSFRGGLILGAARLSFRCALNRVVGENE
jgi:hypothetical protein